MIVAEAVLAKIVGFITAKSAGKLTSLAFDKRKKACRSLTKLYYCVQALDEATDDLIRMYKEMQHLGKPTSFANALAIHGRTIELATNMFVDLGAELERGLRIIDPALATCCHLLYRGKYDFLMYISESVRHKRYGNKHHILLKRPKGQMALVDMEKMYSGAQIAIAAGEKHYWPDSVFDDFSDDFEEVTITAEDDAVLDELFEMLIQQNQLLKTAKESLRTLIKDSFSIEEVLFQSDAHPYK